jgi:hypothetical protein
MNYTLRTDDESCVCPTIEELQTYAQYSPTEKASHSDIASHLDICEICGQLVENFQQEELPPEALLQPLLAKSDNRWAEVMAKMGPAPRSTSHWQSVSAFLDCLKSQVYFRPAYAFAALSLVFICYISVPHGAIIGDVNIRYSDTNSGKMRGPNDLENTKPSKAIYYEFTATRDGYDAYLLRTYTIIDSMNHTDESFIQIFDDGITLKGQSDPVQTIKKGQRYAVSENIPIRKDRIQKNDQYYVLLVPTQAIPKADAFMQERSLRVPGLMNRARLEKELQPRCGSSCELVELAFPHE